MAAARFGNESGEDSDESSCSEENVDDYESYGGVLGYQYEPKKRVRSPVAVRIEPGTEGASPSSIASDSDSRTRSGSVVQLVVALPPDTHSVPERAGNTDWCACSRCAAMPTNLESLCCHDTVRIYDKMSEFTEGELQCMVDHPGFIAICLNPWVLEVAYLQFKHQYQQSMDYPQHEIYRHTAYRQLVRWCWGIVGRNHRVPLPSCVVNKIRETFPNPEGKPCTGFKWSTL